MRSFVAVAKRGRGRVKEPEEVEIREYVPRDAPLIVKAAEETRALDPGAPHLDAPRWRYVLADPNADPEVHFRVAQTPSGRIAGFGYRFDPPRVDGGNYRAVIVVVHPDFRRRGIGHALFEATYGEANEDDDDWFVTSTVDDRSPGGWPFAKSLGFKKAQHLAVMSRDLPGRPLLEPDNDIRIEPFVGVTAWRDWAAIHNEAFAGDPEAIRHDALVLEDNKPDGFRPDHVRFAKSEGNQRIGYLFLRETTDCGYIESIAVRTDTRGQGVGTALMISALGYLIERGHSRCELAVDEGNVAALKMYSRLHFEELGRRLHLRRDGKAPRRK